MNEFLPDLILCKDALQPDGTFGESLQYANYMLLALTFAEEAMLRKYPTAPHSKTSQGVGANSMDWFATSMFYSKPLLGWENTPYARAANFNDSAAIFRPSGDILLHIAARSNDKQAKGLAKWLFEKYYAPVPNQGPHDLAMLGMRNDWGFLTLPLLTYNTDALSPENCDLSLVNSFSNGNAFIRDAWNGKTILAINGGSEPLHGLGHLHGDLNSFILDFKQERLLADPGHSCYRNLIHGLESSSQTHNTCTFLIAKEALGLQEDMAKAALLEQKSVFPRRIIKDRKAGDTIIRGDKRLICAKMDEVAIVGAEVAQSYGQPIEEFSRFWVLAGSNVLFIVDKIAANQPVTTLWNWVIDNENNQTFWQKEANCLTIKKNNSGMKLFHGGSGSFAFPVYGFLHDAYHPQPNQLGEGRSGSSLVFRFTEKENQKTRIVVHAIALDEANLLEKWQFEQNNKQFVLKNDTEHWTLQMNENLDFSIISKENIVWDLKKMEEKYELIKN